MSEFGTRVAAGLAVALVVVACAGCSFSRSSRSSSKSSASSSRSSSGGGGPAVTATQAAFQEEIAALTVLHVGSNGTMDDFQRDVSAAASRNGIPYWELDERVFTAIGIGLERAGVPRESIPAVPFLEGVRNAQHFPAIGNAYGRNR